MKNMERASFWFRTGVIAALALIPLGIIAVFDAEAQTPETTATDAPVATTAPTAAVIPPVPAAAQSVTKTWKGRWKYSGYEGGITLALTTTNKKVVGKYDFTGGAVKQRGARGWADSPREHLRSPRFLSR